MLFFFFDNQLQAGPQIDGFSRRPAADTVLVRQLKDHQVTAGAGILLTDPVGHFR